MGKIIVIAGQKGGIGKSTAAVHLASEWHARGRRTLLVDADPQGSAVAWGNVGADSGVAGPTVVAMGDNLRTQLPTMADAYDVVIVDVPGRLGKRQASALLVADLAVLPTGPSALDAWALSDSVELVKQAQDLRPDLRAVVLVNRADRSANTKAVRAALGESGLPVLRASLGARAVFAEAIAAGRGVTGYARGSVAANEVRRLADELEGLAGFDDEGDRHVA